MEFTLQEGVELVIFRQTGKLNLPIILAWAEIIALLRQRTVGSKSICSMLLRGSP